MTGRSVDGTAFDVEGAGPPVVLVHGLGLNRHMWAGQCAALEPDFAVARYDLLGHGESRAPDVPCRMDEFVGQLCAVIDALRWPDCALVGFSLGGLIVQAFALAHPERVSALAILNAAHDRTADERAAVLSRVEQVAREGPGATVAAALERWFTADFAAQNPTVLAQVRDWILANDPALYPHVYRLLAEADADLAQAIRAIRCPTLVMTGAEDHGNSPAMAERMAAQIPGARAEIVPGLRHMGLMEDPAAFNRLLVPFLERAEAAGGDSVATARGGAT